MRLIRKARPYRRAFRLSRKGKETPPMAQGNISKRELRAIAYRLADDILTRAEELMRADATLSREAAIVRAVDDMAKA